MDCRADIQLASPEAPFELMNYERKVQTSETMIEVAMIRLLLKRLVRKP